MIGLHLEFVFLLLCGLFERKVAVELDENTKYLAVFGEFNLKNLSLKEAVPIAVPWEGSTDFKPTITYLELHNCSGTIDKMTFSKLPDLRSIQINYCHIQHLNPDAFSGLINLEVIGFSRSQIVFEKQPEGITPNRTALKEFKELSFYMTTVSGLTRNSLQDFRFLDKLVFDNSEVHDVGADMLSDLTNITQLLVKTTNFPEFDSKQVLKLTTLKYLALHDLQTRFNVDYSIFKNLPNLEFVLFDTLAYKDLDLENFPKLKVVEVGLGETKDSEVLKDGDLFNLIMERIDALKVRGIENEIVPAGRDHFVHLA